MTVTVTVWHCRGPPRPAPASHTGRKLACMYSGRDSGDWIKKNPTFSRGPPGGGRRALPHTALAMTNTGVEGGLDARRVKS